MIKVTVRIEIECENSQSLNHLEIVTADVERVLARFHPHSIQRIDCNVIGRTLAGTHRKVIALFPCRKVKTDVVITESI